MGAGMSVSAKKKDSKAAVVIKEVVVDYRDIDAIIRGSPSLCDQITVSGYY